LPHLSVLLFSAKYGEGHLKAGEALQSKLESRLTSNVTVRHLDFGAFFFSKTDYLLRKAYSKMICKTPAIWRMLYDKTADSQLKGYRHYMHTQGSENLLDFINEFDPDVIVSTHFFPAEVLAGLKKRGSLKVPLVTVVTDYLVHSVWANPDVDLFLVGSDDARLRLIQAGIAPERIVLTGIPVRACFEGELSKQDALRKLGLEQNKTTVLMMGGSGGFANRETEFMEALFNLSKTLPVQFLVVCGSNTDTYNMLKDRAERGDIKAGVLGYVDNIHEYMISSDLLITKGGALTISEAMTVGLPVIMYKPIPGHERGNAAFVQNGGAGIMITSAGELLETVELLLQNPSKLKGMGLAAKNMLPVHSAENGVISILKLVENRVLDSL